jgi:hypothetical protein
VVAGVDRRNSWVFILDSQEKDETPTAGLPDKNIQERTVFPFCYVWVTMLAGAGETSSWDFEGKVQKSPKLMSVRKP